MLLPSTSSLIIIIFFIKRGRKTVFDFNFEYRRHWNIKKKRKGRGHNILNNFISESKYCKWLSLMAYKQTYIYEIISYL